jgi:hypothetical protein
MAIYEREPTRNGKDGFYHDSNVELQRAEAMVNFLNMKVIYKDDFMDNDPILKEFVVREIVRGANDILTHNFSGSSHLVILPRETAEIELDLACRNLEVYYWTIGVAAAFGRWLALGKPCEGNFNVWNSDKMRNPLGIIKPSKATEYYMTGIDLR